MCSLHIRFRAPLESFVAPVGARIEAPFRDARMSAGSLQLPKAILNLQGGVEVSRRTPGRKTKQPTPSTTTKWATHGGHTVGLRRPAIATENEGRRWETGRWRW